MKIVKRDILRNMNLIQFQVLFLKDDLFYIFEMNMNSGLKSKLKCLLNLNPFDFPRCYPVYVCNKLHQSEQAHQFGRQIYIQTFKLNTIPRTYLRKVKNYQQ